MPELTSQIPFMASLWIRSGYDVKVEVSAQIYQVGAHFKALNEAVLTVLSKILEKFYSFQVRGVAGKTELGGQCIVIMTS